MSMPFRTKPTVDQFLLTPLLIAAVGLGCWLIATAAPRERTVVDDNLYHQNGSFSWSAKTTKSIAYPTGVVKTGDAVFTNLVPAITFKFAYALTSVRNVEVRGTGGMNLDISSDTGWHSIRRLAPSRAFAGPEASFVGRLDLSHLDQLIRAADAETGVTSRRYFVTLLPEIAVRGTVNGAPLRTTYAPPLRFQYDGKRLILDTAAISESEENAVTRRSAGSGPIVEDNIFNLGVARIGVDTARELGAAAAILGFLSFLGLLGWLMTRAERDEPTKLAEQYGDLLVPVKRMPSTKSVVTDVEDFRALVRIAERHNKSIMHWADGFEHTYLLKENGLLYRYSTRGMKRGDIEVQPLSQSDE